MTIGGIKYCSWCGGTGPFNKNKYKRDGLQSRCRVCTRAQFKQWYDSNIEKARRNACEVQARRRRRDPEGHRAYKRALHSANPDKYRAMNRKASKRWRERHPDLFKMRIAEWVRANPLKVRAQSDRRRALLHNAAGHSTPEQVAARIELFGGFCAYCAKRPFEHIDHAVPLAAGGTNWPANLRPACASCNLRKGVQTWRRVVFPGVEPRAK